MFMLAFAFTSKAQHSEGALTVIGTGSSPAVITGADTVFLTGSINGTGTVTLTTTLLATGTSPTITGTITLWVSLDGISYFAHPTSGDATTTLTAQAPSSVPSASTKAYLSSYTKQWSWTTYNPYRFYMVRVISTALGGTSPTFTCSGRYLIRKS